MSKQIDVELCKRFCLAMEISFTLEGKFRQSFAAQQLSVTQSVISDIFRYNREPSKDVIIGMISKFDYYDVGWLLTGDLDVELCDIVSYCFKKSGKNHEDFANSIDLPSLLISSTIGKMVSPSYSVVLKACNCVGVYFFPLFDDRTMPYTPKIDYAN